MKIIKTMAYTAVAAVAAYNMYLATDIIQAKNDLTFENIAFADNSPEQTGGGSGGNSDSYANAGFGANCYGKDQSWDNGSYDPGREFYHNGVGFVTADSVPMYSDEDTINVVKGSSQSGSIKTKASYVFVNSKTTSHSRGRQGTTQVYLIQTVKTYNCIGPGSDCNPLTKFEKFDIVQEYWYI